MKNTRIYQQKNLMQTLEMLRNTELNRSKLEKINNYEDFRKLPITSYNDFQSDIELFKSNPNKEFCKNLVRFQPTSGSTSHIKWIPYNQDLLDQFDEAASIWLADLARQYPKILQGQHYWSLSWLPDNLRSQQQIDDSEILSPMKRFFMQKIFAVPNEVMLTETIEENLFATVCFLAASEQLSFISVWSPTFLMTIIEIINNDTKEVIKTLELGLWPEKYSISVSAPKSIKQAQKLKFEIDYEKLWPKLALISCWDTAQSALYAEKLKSFFPKTDFQGKGLWATEGIVTLPIGKSYLLSYQSHFYEFEEIETQKVYPAWELKMGMEVSPIITTPNGLLRYKLSDRLLVEGHRDACPKLKFLGRIHDSDLVGEKLSHSIVDDLFKRLKCYSTPLSLIGIHSPKDQGPPYYMLLTNDADSKTSELLESILCENYHYKLARDLNQLAQAKVIATQDAHKIYEQLCLNKGMIKGNIKIDPLITIETDEYIYDYK